MKNKITTSLQYFTWYNLLDVSNNFGTSSNLHGIFLLEKIAFVFMFLLTFFALYNVPSWGNFLTEPCHLASALCGLTVLFMFITRQFGAKALVIEPLVIMFFLAGMPLVYIASCLLNGIFGFWLWVELLAFPIYLFLAILGLKKSPWFLVFGVAAHGLVWDSWHYSTSEYIPNWYAIGCLLADIGISFYVATRISTWRTLEKPATFFNK